MGNEGEKRENERSDDDGIDDGRAFFPIHLFFFNLTSSTTSPPQLTSFADLSPAIADARFVGPSAEKKARAALASTILPRLAMHEGLPPALVKPLLALWHKGRPGGGNHSSSAIASIDAKTSRLALSIAGLLLGPGEAGTPTPLPGAAPPSATVDAGAAEAVRASLVGVPGLDPEAASSSSSRADPTPGLTEGALRLLAAAARGGSGGGGGAASNNNNNNNNNSSNSTSSSSSSKWDADFVSALGVALARGEARAAAFLDANGEAGATALAALAAAAAEAATEGGGAGEGGGGASSSSSSSKILGALTSSSSVAKRRAAAAAAVADASDALHGALAAARASLKGRALRDAALRAGAGAGSADPLCARHALALMACVARGDPARAARAFGLIRNDGSRSRKSSSSVLASFDLAAAASTALAAYETSALVLQGGGSARPSSAGGGGGSSSSSSSSSSLSSVPSPTPGLNLDDPLARVNAARLLGAMLFAGIGGGSAAAAVSYSSETTNGGGASMFSLLAALATRDADDMVALEACKALAGWSGAGGLNAFSSASASNYTTSTSTSTSSNAAMDEASARDAAARARAFAVLCARANDNVDATAGGLTMEDAVLAAVCARVRGALLSGNAPLVCAGARAAAALAEAAVRGYDAAVGGGNATNNSSSKRAADAVVAALASALAAPLAAVALSASPAEAELALEALLWMQAMAAHPSAAVVVLDAGKIFALAGCLSESLATAALAVAKRVLTAVSPRVLSNSSAASSSSSPTALERTLLVSTALVAGNPSKSRGEAALPELWATAARLGGWRGRAAAARAALAVLEAPCPVLLIVSGSGSDAASSIESLDASVADDLAWTAVQQSAAWWLGEHGNAASGEVVGGGAVVDGGKGVEEEGKTKGAAAGSTGLSSAPISDAMSLASGR